MEDDALEELAASHLCDSSDPTLLTIKELKDSWGSCTNFMLSYGLKPYNFEDLDEAKAISRALKENDLDEEEDGDDDTRRLKIWTDGAAKVK